MPIVSPSLLIKRKVLTLPERSDKFLLSILNGKILHPSEKEVIRCEIYSRKDCDGEELGVDYLAIKRKE